MKINRNRIHKGKLSNNEEGAQNLRYWLSRSAKERIAAVDFLRSQVDGTQQRLQRVARVVQRVSENPEG
jgi:hypothetical protein